MKLNVRGMRLLARLLPVERGILAAVGVLALAIAGVAIAGDRSQPRVLAFSWAERPIGRSDRSLTLTFDRPMDWESIAEGLDISPALPGKVSWAGHTFAFTPSDLLAYGEDYTLRLEGARAQPPSPRQAARALPTFEASFATRDRAFAYLGVEGDEAGRLILRNETRDRTTELTPLDLVVTNFEPYATGDRILFSAYERHQGNGIADQQLYTVSTGLGGATGERAGRIQLLLPADEYQNLRFDLAERGDLAIVQRVNRSNRADASLWVVPVAGEPRSLGLQSNEFKLTPEGDAVAIAQERGVALVPLGESAEGWQFFPGYSRLLAFSARDRRAKLLVRDNDDLSQSLYLLEGRGRARELMQTRGRFLDCTFEPRHEMHLYCLHTEPLDAEQAIASPFLTLVELEDAEGVPLVALADDPNIRMSLAPDGRDLLFDQVVRPTRQRSDRPAEIEGSIWQLSLPDLASRRAYVNFRPPREVRRGVDPHWLP